MFIFCGSAPPAPFAGRRWAVINQMTVANKNARFSLVLLCCPSIIPLAALAFMWIQRLFICLLAHCLGLDFLALDEFLSSSSHVKSALACEHILFVFFPSAIVCFRVSTWPSATVHCSFSSFDEFSSFCFFSSAVCCWFVFSRIDRSHSCTTFHPSDQHNYDNSERFNNVFVHITRIPLFEHYSRTDGYRNMFEMNKRKALPRRNVIHW